MATTPTLPSAQPSHPSRADGEATRSTPSYSMDPLAILERNLVEYHKHHPFHHLHFHHLHGDQQLQQPQQQQQQPQQAQSRTEPERGRRLSVNPLPVVSQSPQETAAHQTAQQQKQQQHHDVYGPTLTVGAPGAAAGARAAVSRSRSRFGAVSPSVSPSPSPSTDDMMRSPSPGARRCMAATAAWVPRLDRRQSWDGQAYRRAMMVKTTGLAAAAADAEAGPTAAAAAAKTAEAEAQAQVKDEQAAAREQQAWATAAARTAAAGGEAARAH